MIETSSEIMTGLISAVIALIMAVVAYLKAKEATAAKSALSETNAVMVKAAVQSVQPPNVVSSQSGTFELGFTVLPAFNEGQSPYVAKLAISASPQWGEHEVKTVTIDWDDGKCETFPLSQGSAFVTHTYVYVAERQYTGHTFYPKFTLQSIDGITKVLNTEKTGRCCSIWVTA